MFDQICPKWVFPVGNGKITFSRASMVVTYYIKLFYMGSDRHNGILMSLLLLVVETVIRLMHFQFKPRIQGDASLFTLIIFINFIKSLINRDLIFNQLTEI